MEKHLCAPHTEGEESPKPVLPLFRNTVGASKEKEGPRKMLDEDDKKGEKKMDEGDEEEACGEIRVVAAGMEEREKLRDEIPEEKGNAATGTAAAVRQENLLTPHRAGSEEINGRNIS